MYSVMSSTGRPAASQRRGSSRWYQSASCSISGAERGQESDSNGGRRNQPPCRFSEPTPRELAQMRTEPRAGPACYPREDQRGGGHDTDAEERRTIEPQVREREKQHGPDARAVGEADDRSLPESQRRRREPPVDDAPGG